MKLTVVSHACLLIESGSDKLLLDPWLLGSCYWRSWWHYPEARADLFDPAAISAIYYTHEHPDHLHFPSLRKFPQTTRILVPRFPVDRMARTVRERGWTRCEELAHGGVATVGSLKVYSYQYGLDDSIAVVTDGKTVVLDLNDAKAGGRALQQILDRHPKVDFMLRSHAPAQAYPLCYTAEDPKDLELLPLSYYTESFAAAVETVKPRYAIPFASNVCHLHPESIDQNEHMIAPEDAAEAAHGRFPGSDAVVMAPGDSWEEGKGFTLAQDRPAREAEIARMLAEKKEKLAQADAEEKAIPAIDFAAFRDYGERFARAVPWALRRAYPARVAFEAPGGEYFVVDLGRARVERVSTEPGVHSIVKADAHMLADAVAKGGLNLIWIGKRARVALKRGGLTCDAAFWGLLTVFELGYFPVRNILGPRGLAVLLGRWREMIAYVPVFARPSKSLEKVIESAQREGGAMKTLRVLWPVLAAAAAFYLAGLGWGLPSVERAAAVYAPAQLNDAFYRRVEDNRRAMYERIGLNIQAAYGRGEWNGELLPSTTSFQLIRYPAGKEPDPVLMHGYSSFMLRAVDQDEQFSLNALSRFKPRKLDFDSHQTSTGGAYLYPLAGFFGLLHVVGYVHLVSDPLFYYRNPDELGRLYIAGRLLSVLAGLGCLVLIFSIGSLLYDEKTGLWAAALFGSTPFMIAWTHLLKLHTSGAFLALWCLLLCLRGAKQRRPAEFFKANLLFGLAVGAAKFYWILAIPMWLCYLLAHEKKVSRKAWLSLIGWNLMAVAVFALTNPYAVLGVRELLDEMRAESGWYSSSLNPLAALRLAGLPLRLGLGPAVWFSALACLAGLLYRRGASERLLLMVGAPIFLIISFLVSSAAGDPATVRFCLCPAALLLILAAGWLREQSPLRATRWPSLILGAALAVNLGLAGLSADNFLRDSRRRSNNFNAGRWIEENLAKDAALGFSTPAPMVDRFPPLRFADHALVFFNGPVGEADAKRLPPYYVTRGRSEADLPPAITDNYEIIKTFNNMTWRDLSFEDPFTSANFPVVLLAKKSR